MEHLKILLIRTAGNIVNQNSYNLQEIGLAKALCKKGIQCDIVYFYGNNTSKIQELEFDKLKIKIYWIKGISILHNGIFYKLDNILSQYDIIQAAEIDQWTSLYLAFFSRFRDKVTIYHGPYRSQFNRKYLLKFNLTKMIPVNKKQKAIVPIFAKSNLAKKLLEEYGIKNIIVTGVGLDVDKFTNAQKNDNIEKLICNVKNSNVLLYIGKIEKRRSITFLIKLLAEIKKENDSIKLILIGDGTQEYIRECFHLIDELKLEDNIVYIKKVEQSQLPYIYEIADVFLLPTQYEIFGMVLMEAMYFKVPVITTFNAGSDTLIKNKENGLILDLNIDVWKKEILDIINNKGFHKTIGEKAKETIINEFLWDKISEKMIPVYYQIMTRNNKSEDKECK